MKSILSAFILIQDIHCSCYLLPQVADKKLVYFFFFFFLVLLLAGKGASKSIQGHCLAKPSNEALLSL